MKYIHSLEGLNPSQLSLIEAETKCLVRMLSIDQLLENFDEHLIVEVLICRDRDDISSIINVCSNLKLIFIVSTGVDKLPFKRLLESNIVVCNTGGLNSEIMSQYVMGYILSQSVKICENLINQTNCHWKKYQCVDSLEGKNLLIVGAGRTGQLIASKASQFGLNCVGIKNHVSKLDNFREVTTLDSLNEYLGWADYVVCTIPLTPETTYLFSYDRFCKMKPTATFVNVSRGKHVVTEDLVQALKERKIKSAVLDVFETEPLMSDDELWKVPNLYITPHTSGRLENFMDGAIRYFINNYTAFTKGETLPNRVNLYDEY